MDVANERTKQPNQTGIPMQTLWEVVYIIMAILAFVVPFAFFYYEAEDPDQTQSSKQITSAIKWDIVWAVCFFLPTFVLWIFIGYVEVPVTKLYAGFANFTEGVSLDFEPPVDAYRIEGQHITYRISFVLYLISMLTFLGAFLLILFGGIGLAALPMDFINGWRKRPKPMSLQQYTTIKLIIGKRALALLSKGQQLKEKLNRIGGRPKARKDIRDLNKLRTNVFIIEHDYKRLDKTYNKGRGAKILKIVWEWTQLFLGIFGLVISVTWLIHIFVYLVPPRKPISGFLNTLFNSLDNAFGLFGTCAYAIYSFYLLWCVIKGNFKFGLRIPFFCQIHPMRIGETLMNAFLFNAFILLLASFAVVQFCVKAFSGYARFTGIAVIFNVGVSNLRYITYFWQYYYWAIILIAILAAIYLILNPSDRKAAEKDINLDELPV